MDQQPPEVEIHCDIQILSGCLRFGVKMFGYGDDYEMTASFSSDGEIATIQGFAPHSLFIRDKNRVMLVVTAACDAFAKLGLGIRWKRKSRNGRKTSWITIPLNKEKDYAEIEAFCQEAV